MRTVNQNKKTKSRRVDRSKENKRRKDTLRNLKQQQARTFEQIYVASEANYT